MHLTFSQTESHCRSLQFDDETDSGNCDGYEYDRSADDRSTDYRSAGDRNADDRSAFDRSADDRSADDGNAEDRSADDRNADDRGVVYGYNTATSLMSGLHKSRAHELFYSGANRLFVFSMEFILFHPSGV